jgi:L-iditol 2-dehydrogenase
MDFEQSLSRVNLNRLHWSDVEMKVLSFPGDRNVNLQQQPIPEIKSDEVLIEIRAAGLCGSDLHLFYRPTSTQREEGIFGLKFPVSNIPGHEPCGEIVEVGREVRHLKKGDRVAVAHITGCGHCSICRKGWDMHCKEKQTYGGDRQGAFGEFMAARAKDCAVLPENISYQDGAFFACGASTGYYALQRANLRGGETVVIVGLGPVGLAGAFFADKLGAHVIGIDVNHDRCEYALNHGVHFAINPAKEDVNTRVLEITGGIGADVTIDFTGAPGGRLTALDTAKLWGRTVLIGFGEGGTLIDAEMQIIEKQLTLTGAWVFSFPEFMDLIAYSSHHNISLSSMYTKTYGIDDGALAFTEFDRGSLGKTFIVK